MSTDAATIIGVVLLAVGMFAFAWYTLTCSTNRHKKIEDLVAKGELSDFKDSSFAGTDLATLLTSLLPCAQPEHACVGVRGNDTIIVCTAERKESWRDSIGIFVIAPLGFDSKIELHAVARSRLKSLAYYEITARSIEGSFRYCKLYLHQSKKQAPNLPRKDIEETIVNYILHNMPMNYVSVCGGWIAIGFDSVNFQRILTGENIFPVKQIDYDYIESKIEILRSAMSQVVLPESNAS